ncbi:MAG: ZIP family metal transporter [Thermoplasmatota archaeon]
MRTGVGRSNAAILLAVLLLAAAPTAAQATGDRFLLADGTLGPQVEGSPASCLALSPTGPQTATQSFVGQLANDTIDIQPQTAVLSLQIEPGATAGTGFRLTASLSIDGLTTLTATKTYAQGAAIDSPEALAFTIPGEFSSAGNLSVQIELAKTGGAPVLGTQSVSILCNDADSKLHSLQATAPDTVIPGPDGPGDKGGNGPSKLGVMLIAIGAGIVTLVAGLLVLVGKRISPRRLHLFLGLTAGLLMALAIVDLIPEAIEQGGEGVAIAIALSLLVLFLIKSMAGEHSHGGAGDHHHDGEGHPHGELATHSAQFAAVAFAALLIHRLVDGLALPGAFAAGDAIGFAASSAILLHQFPDGLAAASVFLATGWTRKRVIAAVAILSMATPLGSLVGLAIASFETFLPYLLGIAAATFLFIALAELLPELRARQYRGVVVTGVILGYVAAALIEVIAFGLGVEV